MQLHYGSEPGLGSYYAQKPGAYVNRANRANVPAILMSFFVPWFLFSGIYAATSFSTRYQRPWLTGLIVVGGALKVGVVAWLAVHAFKKRQAGLTQREPAWFFFWTGSMLVNFLAAVSLGSVNYWTNTKPWCEVMALNYFSGVDPATTSGDQLMDTGRATFTDGSRIDLGRWMSFKNVDLYCVAPVIESPPASSAGTTVEKRDVWVAGLNCCEKSFQCGDYANLNARAGLRVMREDQTPFYRLAVNQAEAAYNIVAEHPVLFYWTQDPLMEVQTYQEDAWRSYYLGVATSLAFQVFTVFGAIVVFRQHGFD